MPAARPTEELRSNQITTTPLIHNTAFITSKRNNYNKHNNHHNATNNTVDTLLRAVSRQPREGDVAVPHTLTE